MTPHRRTKKRADGTRVPVGSLVLEWERSMRPLGRIYRATGLTPDANGRRQLTRLRAACETLFQQGRLDILEAVRDGVVHPLRLLEAQRREQLSALPSAAYLEPFAPAMQAWADRTANRFSRKNRRAVVKTLTALAPAATLADLPELVRRGTLQLQATPATANRLREQTMAFVRDRLGRQHELHRAVAAVPAQATRPVRRRVHLTPAEFHAVLPQLGPAREAFWGLCLTGANPKEFWEDGWEIVGAGILIRGQKARARHRVVPLIAPIAAPTVSRDVLTWWLNKVGLYPYAARHSYSRWLADAGIDPWRVRVYMGHAAGSQTEQYQRGDMQSYLVADAARLRAHLGFPPEPARLEVTA